MIGALVSLAVLVACLVVPLYELHAQEREVSASSSRVAPSTPVAPGCAYPDRGEG